MVSTKKMAVLAIMITMLLSPIAYAASSTTTSTATASNGGHVIETSIATSSMGDDATAISEAIASENGVVESKSVVGPEDGTATDIVQNIGKTGTSGILDTVINMNEVPIAIPDIEKPYVPPCEIVCDPYSPPNEDIAPCDSECDDEPEDTPCDNGCDDESDDASCDSGCDEGSEDTPCNSGCDDETEDTSCDSGCNDESDGTPCNNGCNGESEDAPCNNGCDDESEDAPCNSGCNEDSTDTSCNNGCEEVPTCESQSGQDADELVTSIGIDGFGTDMNSFFERYSLFNLKRGMVLEPDMQ